MSSSQVTEQNEAVDAAPAKPVSRFTRWFRSPLFNVIIVGLISFTQPGIWNALNSESPFYPKSSKRLAWMLTLTRHRCWRPTGALSCEWVEFLDIRVWAAVYSFLFFL